MDSTNVFSVLPDSVLENIFSYLSLKDLASCALVCKSWQRYLNSDENNEIWRLLCFRKISEKSIKASVSLCSYNYK